MRGTDRHFFKIYPYLLKEKLITNLNKNTVRFLSNYFCVCKKLGQNFLPNVKKPGKFVGNLELYLFSRYRLVF